MPRIDIFTVIDDFLACAKPCKYIIACHLPELYSLRPVISMVRISAIEGGLV